MKRSAKTVAKTQLAMEVKMRGIPLLLIGAALASCTTAPPQPMRTAQGQQQFEMLLAGKVAGTPVSCVPSYRANDMIRIDEQTIAFRDGSSRVYVAHMRGACSNLTSGNYALVTKSFGSGLCSGDIARVVDTSNHITVGSCAFGDFVPYTKAGVRSY
jgi:hypothetical protein